MPNLGYITRVGSGNTVATDSHLNLEPVIEITIFYKEVVVGAKISLK